MEQPSAGGRPAAQGGRGHGEGPDPVEVNVKDGGQEGTPPQASSSPFCSTPHDAVHTALPTLPGCLPPFCAPGLPQATR